MIPVLVVLAAGVTGLAWSWCARPDQRRATMVAVAVGGLGFQLVHALEHVVQAGAWVAAPDQPPFLTPWAEMGRDALAVGGDTTLGNELLHLVGNVIFLAGLVAFAGMVRPRSRSLRVALAGQGIHVAEHLGLTFTTSVLDEALGVTTLFGLLDAGPALWSLRVMAHLGLNAVATVAAGVAILQWARARTLLRHDAAAPEARPPVGVAPGVDMENVADGAPRTAGTHQPKSMAEGRRRPDWPRRRVDRVLPRVD